MLRLWRTWSSWPQPVVPNALKKLANPRVTYTRKHLPMKRWSALVDRLFLCQVHPWPYRRQGVITGQRTSGPSVGVPTRGRPGARFDTGQRTSGQLKSPVSVRRQASKKTGVIVSLPAVCMPDLYAFRLEHRNTHRNGVPCSINTVTATGTSLGYVVPGAFVTIERHGILFGGRMIMGDKKHPCLFWGMVPNESVSGGICDQKN